MHELHTKLSPPELPASAETQLAAAVLAIAGIAIAETADTGVVAAAAVRAKVGKPHIHADARQAAGAPYMHAGVR